MITLTLILMLTIKERNADIADLFGFPGYGRLDDSNRLRHHAFLPDDSDASTGDNGLDNPFSRIFRLTGDRWDDFDSDSDFNIEIYSDIDIDSDINIGSDILRDNDCDGYDGSLVYPLVDGCNEMSDPFIDPFGDYFDDASSEAGDFGITNGVNVDGSDDDDSITYQDDITDPFSDIYINNRF